MSTLSFSESLKTAIRIAQSVARENKNEQFSLPHMLFGLLHKDAGLHSFLQSLGKDVPYMREWAEIKIEEYPKTGKMPDMIAADDNMASVFEEADNIRFKLGVDDITPVCVLAAIVKPNVGFASDELKSFPLREKEILDLYISDASVQQVVAGMGNERSQAAATGKAAPGNAFLLKYCIDRMSLAREGKTDPIIGRDKETRMMMEILSRRTKPNVIITGDPGVGKTALVDGFALSIAQDKVPASLRGAQLFELDAGALFAGASYKGEAEERLKGIIKEIKQYDKAILFIDEIHTILDPKGAAGQGIGNLLKPELARGELTVIGATTNDEYRKIIEPEQAFSRRFELVKVEEPDIVTSARMLERLCETFESHHNLKVEKDVLPECVRLAKRYVKDRRLPDSAVDLLDRTMAALNMMNDTSQGDIDDFSAMFGQIRDAEEHADKIAQYQWLFKTVKNKLSPVLFGQLTDTADVDKIEAIEEMETYIENSLGTLRHLASARKEVVSKSELAAIVAYKTGIPMGKIQAKEQQRLADMELIVKQRVVGQDHAVKALADAIVESRSGLNKPGQPIGSFFLLGPTGTGKTEVTKAVADFLFNDEKAMIRFDMSEFKEEHSAALLYGAPPGYVGYEEGGLLVNKIRQHPYSVVLFDEIEKAHPSVFDIFLQILDEGKMHDRLGKEGDFSNSLIIFTSNIGSEWIVEQFGKDVMPKSAQLMEIMMKYFRPEFLARLTEIIPFAPISEKNVVKILEIQMKSLVDSLSRQSIGIQISDDAKTKIALTGFTPKYGARQISGVIRTFLRRPISKLIVTNQVMKGDTINVAVDDAGEILFSIIK